MTIDYARYFPTIAAWLRAGGGAIAGVHRDYDQSQWDCGTACCAWGALHLAATGRPTEEGPTPEFREQHPLLASIMEHGHEGARPVLIALMERGDIRAATAKARAAGLKVYIDEPVIVTDDDDGVWCYGTCAVTVRGGTAECFDRCAVVVYKGDVGCYDRCAVVVNGGNAICYDNCTVVVDGGDVNCKDECTVVVYRGLVQWRRPGEHRPRLGEVQCERRTA